MAVNKASEADKVEEGLIQQAAREELGIKQILQSEGYRPIFIPKDPQNKDDTHYPIGVNGIIFNVRRGEMVQVPLAVAEVWEDSFRRTEEANDRIDRSTSEKVELGL